MAAHTPGITDSKKRPGLVAGIGPWDAAGLLINGVIGAGIFGMPSKLFGLAGDFSIFSILVCVACIAPVVLCFAEMSSRFTSTGGAYAYALDAYGPTLGFTVGWLMLLSRLTAFAANSNLLPSYLGFFFPSLAAGWPRAALLTAVAVWFVGVNLAGVKQSGRMGTVFAAGKLIPLVIFAVAGLFYLDPSRFEFSAAPSVREFTGSILLAVYAFLGVELATVPAAEVKNAARTLPRVLLIGMSGISLAYVAIQVVCVGTYPGLAHSERPLADAAAAFLGPGGAALMVAAVILSLIGNLNMVVLVGSRLTFAMAESGAIPSIFARVDERRRVPSNAILVVGVLMLALALSGSFVYMALISTLARLLCYVSTCVAVPLIARRASAPSAGFRVPGGMWIPALGTIVSLALIASSTWPEIRATALAVVIGLAIYLAQRRWARQA